MVLYIIIIVRLDYVAAITAELILEQKPFFFPKNRPRSESLINEQDSDKVRCAKNENFESQKGKKKTLSLTSYIFIRRRKKAVGSCQLLAGCAFSRLQTED